MRTPVLSRRAATTAALLAAALLGACTTAQDALTDPDAPSGVPTPGTGTGTGTGAGSGAAAPSSVVGAWRAGTISSLGFWDSHTGDYLGTAGGLSVAFTFGADGQYTMQLYVLTRAYSCVTQAWTELRGTVSFDGGTFVTHPTTGRYQGSDTCIASNNFTRAATGAELAQEVRTYHWSFEANPNDGRTYLMIGRDPSARSFFSRVP